MIDFDYAIVRWVPSVVRGEFHNVGVVLHAPTADFLDARFSSLPGAPQRVQRYLANIELVARGDARGGPLAALSRSERFHWLVAPRSDSLQTSPCHPGRAASGDLTATLERIFAHVVAHGETP